MPRAPNPLAKRHLRRLDALSRDCTPEEALAALNFIVNDRTPKNSTKLVRYSLVKRYFKEHLPDVVGVVQVPVSLVRAVEEERERALDTRINIVIRRSWIDTILTWKESESVVEMAAYLQLVSGRRVSEIHSTRFFALGQKIGTYDLRKKAPSVDRLLCRFPLYHTTPGPWLGIMETMRSKLNGRSVSALTRAMNRRLGAVDPLLSTHKLRGMYANLMWHIDGEKQIKTGFIKEILCLESQNVAIHYSAFIIQ